MVGFNHRMGEFVEEHSSMLSIVEAQSPIAMCVEIMRWHTEHSLNEGYLWGTMVGNCDDLISKLSVTAGSATLKNVRMTSQKLKTLRSQKAKHSPSLPSQRSECTRNRPSTIATVREATRALAEPRRTCSQERG